MGVGQISRVLADPNSAVPSLIRGSLKLLCTLVEEIRLMELRTAELERELTQVARHSPACTTLLSVPGLGLLTSTALVAATSGVRDALQECVSLRLLVWLDLEGAFSRGNASSGAHFQTR